MTDATGIVRGIDFDEREPSYHTKPTKPVVVLRYMPRAVEFELDKVDGVDPPRMDLIDSKPCPLHKDEGCDKKCKECKSRSNWVLVTPFKNISSWSLEVKLDGGHMAKVKVKRRQLPLVCLFASTLHTLQGSTCDPGLIFHWKFPRRLSADLIWLAAYVALSRVRKLANFRSVGLENFKAAGGKSLRQIIEGGPPASIPAMFAKYFADKEKATQAYAKEAMNKLGWST